MTPDCEVRLKGVWYPARQVEWEKRRKRPGRLRVRLASGLLRWVDARLVRDREDGTPGFIASGTADEIPAIVDELRRPR